MAVIWNAWNTAFPSTSAFPSAEPPGTPFRSRSLDDRERHTGPERPWYRRPEDDECEQRREDDVEPGDEAGTRDGGEFEPRRLQAVGNREEHAYLDPRGVASSWKRPKRLPRERREGEGRDREAHGQEREEGVERERILHLDECHAPDSRDADEREERAASAHDADSLRSSRWDSRTRSADRCETSASR